MTNKSSPYGNLPSALVRLGEVVENVNDFFDKGPRGHGEVCRRGAYRVKETSE
jgi:hypothetical protein